MRFSATLLAMIAASGLGVTPAPATPGRSANFCGSVPANWNPPWQRKPVPSPGKEGGCHLLMCERRLGRSRGAGAAT
jgi:hypothetical protein